jgi:hypothetical protein
MRLDILREDIDAYIRHTDDLKTNYPSNFMSMIQRGCSLLANSDSSVESIEAGHILVDEFADAVKDDGYLLAMAYVFQGAVYYACSDHEKGSALAQNAGILLGRLLSHSANMPSLYHQGLSLYASAGELPMGSKRRTLKRLGVKRHKILRSWAKDGCINVVHYVAILDAELAVLNRMTRKKVQELYKKAILLTDRGGFLQDLAVASERFGRYLHRNGESIEAGRRYDQAVQYYEEWGFPRKAMVLRDEQQDLIAAWTVGR